MTSAIFSTRGTRVLCRQVFSGEETRSIGYFTIRYELQHLVGQDDSYFSAACLQISLHTIDWTDASSDIDAPIHVSPCYTPYISGIYGSRQRYSFI